MPPKIFVVTHPDSIKSKNYLERGFHGIPIAFGHVDYENLKDVLESATWNVKKYVLAKGEDKCRLFRQFLSHLTFIDLNSLSCVKHYKPSFSCLFHFDKLDKECAFRNCLSNATWLCDFLREEQDSVEYLKTHCPLVCLENNVETKYLPFSRIEYCF